MLLTYCQLFMQISFICILSTIMGIFLLEKAWYALWFAPFHLYAWDYFHHVYLLHTLIPHPFFLCCGDCLICDTQYTIIHHFANFDIFKVVLSCELPSRVILCRTIKCFDYFFYMCYMEVTLAVDIKVWLFVSVPQISLCSTSACKSMEVSKDLLWQI